MSHYEITLDQYSKALAEASDSNYLAHLVNDYKIMPDGKVLARWSIDKTPTNTYVIRDRFKLFSSLEESR